MIDWIGWMRSCWQQERKTYFVICLAGGEKIDWQESNVWSYCKGRFV